MTREEAIIILDCERPYGNCGCGASIEEIEDALNMAIKALEQQPCEDAISREGAIGAVTNLFEMSEYPHPYPQGKPIRLREIKEKLKQLPPVQPKTKTGYWIYIGNSEVNGLKICECDVCGKRTYGSHAFCPNCGAKMIEPQESEDKE